MQQELENKKALQVFAGNYPESPYCDTVEILTKSGIGEAFVSSLNEKGILLPLARTMLRTPMSRMDILTDQEIESNQGIKTQRATRKSSRRINLTLKVVTSATFI